MKSFSDQAIPGETPVSFTEIGKEVIANELGSRDIPLVLNSTPSVYATTDGGAAGDARVNVRGFSQRNVSILINGVPTNDIENGWLYWSNWDGLGDVTSTIQVQRGLSNVTLPTPSIGGTMNIITDPASAHRSGSIKFELGSDSFRKATLVWNSGLLKDRVAFTVGLVAKTGDGYVDGTYTKGTGYYLGATFKINENNRIDLFAVGAPQRHGQRTFASNIAAYDADYARKLGYTEAQISQITLRPNSSSIDYNSSGAAAQGPIDAGYAFNPNYAPVSSSYTGKQYYWGGLHNREDRNFMNERENYFHKPQVNLNWYSTISDNLKLATVLYYSGGRGGGSGTLGSLLRYGSTSPLYGNVDWDSTIARNEANTQTDGSTNARGILRNSVNNQDQVGIVSKATYEISDDLKITTGIDWRTATIDHFREVRDLLGGDYYLPTAAQASEFWADGTNTRLGLGDKVDYYETNHVDWLGLFAQAQYHHGPVTAFGVYGYSLVDYAFRDHFRRAIVDPSQEFVINAKNATGNQIKGGIQYAFNDQFSAFVNAGWVSKAPIFDGAIDDVTGTAIPQVNEKFNSYETGLRYTSADRKFNVSSSFYYTEWRDRTYTQIDEQNNTIAYERGVDQNYSGLEIEGGYVASKYLRFDAAASFGNWYYTKDVQFQQYDISTRESTVTAGQLLYLKGLKVGDAPQTQIALAATVYPTQGLSVKLEGRNYTRYWSDFSPDSRKTSTDRSQSWEIPNYSVFDLHVSYRLPLQSEKYDVRVFAHVFNLFDKTYVSDATDESSFEAVGTNLAPRHSAQRAEVFLGAPRTINAGAMLSF